MATNDVYLLPPILEAVDRKHGWEDAVAGLWEYA